MGGTRAGAERRADLEAGIGGIGAQAHLGGKFEKHGDSFDRLGRNCGPNGTVLQAWRPGALPPDPRDICARMKGVRGEWS
jgi:hypothetical protein